MLGTRIKKMILEGFTRIAQVFAKGMKDSIRKQRGVTGKKYPKVKYPERKTNPSNADKFMIDTGDFQKHFLEIEETGDSVTLLIPNTFHASGNVTYDELAGYHEHRCDFWGYNKAAARKGMKIFGAYVRREMPKYIKEMKRGLRNIK